MDTDNCINLIAAIIVGGGTLFLGIMAWRTIRQTRSIQKRERKERKLITIVEWATDIAKCETSVPLTPLPIVELIKSLPQLDKTKVDMIFEYHNRNPRINLIMRYQNLDAMGKRMVLISKSLDKQFSCNLENLAQKTTKKLQTHIKLGYKWVAEEVSDDEYQKHWKLLLRSAMSLAEKAEAATD